GDHVLAVDQSVHQLQLPDPLTHGCSVGGLLARQFLPRSYPAQTVVKLTQYLPVRASADLEPDAFAATVAAFDPPVSRESFEQTQPIAAVADGTGRFDDLRHCLGFVAYSHRQARGVAVAPGQMHIYRSPGIQHRVGDELTREELSDFSENLRIPDPQDVSH